MINFFDKTNDKLYNFISFVKGYVMERMTIKEFKTENNIEIINGLMKINNGYITSKKLSDFGIHRMYLNIMKKTG